MVYGQEDEIPTPANVAVPRVTTPRAATTELVSCTSTTSPIPIPNNYCLDGSVIKIVTGTTTSPSAGSTKFGKSGLPSGNFFFDMTTTSNEGAIITEGSDSTTGVGYSCNSSGCSLIKPDNKKTYINSKATGLKCAYLECDTSECTCKEAKAKESYYDNTSERVINCSSNRCSLTSVAGYYIDYGVDDLNYLIKCSDNKCTSTEHPGDSSNYKTEFYINAGLDKSTKPIIYFDNAQSSPKFSEISPKDTNGVFLDSDTISGEYYKNVIVCSSTTKCSSVTMESGMYLNADPTASTSSLTIPQLVQCTSTGCKGYTLLDEYDTNANSKNLYFIDGLTSKLIQCIYDSSATKCSLYTNDTAGKYYLDYASESTATTCPENEAVTPTAPSTTPPSNKYKKGFCSLSIISCNKSQICSSHIISTNSQFIDGDSYENILMCATFGEDFFCTSLKAEELSYYYINSGNTGEYPLLFCGVDSTTKKCTEKKASLTGYYMTDNGSTISSDPYKQNYVGYLIHCVSATQCVLSSDLANSGYYVNAGVDNTNLPLIKYDSDAPNIEEVPPAEKESYYIDASSLEYSTYSNLIYCESIKSCASIDPKDGYYYNADGDDENDRIISCSKVGCVINDSVQRCTVDEKVIPLSPGNYCYQRANDSGEDEHDINFVISEFEINSESIDPSNQNITYTSSGSVYHYVTVTLGNFPGITSLTTTLFEITSNSITRVANDGVYIINSKNERVQSISGSIDIGKSYSLYTCSQSTKLCGKIQSCKEGTYFFDEKSGKGYQCSSNEISPIDTAGCYVDSSYVVHKTLTPGVLQCEDNGSCVRYTPTNTYFINAGVDNNTKALIYCASNTCETQVASIGYYRAEFGHSGVIVCTTSTNCKISSLRYNFYLNNGEDKITKSIIVCSKGVNCETKHAYEGYYLIQENNNLLINCKMPSSCEVEEGSTGYYYNAANNYRPSDIETIIRCSPSTYTDSVLCVSEKKNEGFYLSGKGHNILVDCMGSKCKQKVVEDGIFLSAALIQTSVKNVLSQGRDKFSDEEGGDAIVVDRVERVEDNGEMLSKESNVMLKLNEQRLIGRAQSISNEPASTLIICSGGVCNELTAEELNLIPVCTYSNDMCYLDNSKNINNSQNKIITSVFAGDFCTDMNRSTIYFATETIVEYNDVISGVLSTSKTVTKNCIRATSQYSSNLFTVGNSIYQVNNGLIMEVHDKGYYFINIDKNKLVYGHEIKEYNNSNVRLYKCDGISCRIMDKPTSDTYYTDVTKRILKYSVEEGKYSFISKKDNICMFADNTCTPKYDIEENDFCITAEGYIVVAGEKIKSRETGKCYMSTSITENVLAYSYNSVLYLLNSNAAKKVVTNGYYFAENNYYNSAEYKSFNATSSGITLFGCINNSCQVYEPQPDIYYFDMITNYLIQKKDKTWISPSKVGYINVSINPEEVYIYSYTMSNTKELLLTKVNKDGWYYTIDKKMYQCTAKIKSCKEIDDTAYVFTNSNEIYYCVVDSEGEPTECNKRICTVDQIYYIKDRYYKCTNGSYMELIRSKQCDHDEVVVINFPLIYTNSFPIKIYNTISDIAKNNHHVPTQKLSRNSLETIQGVFTNCTYDAYDELANYDQICMQNYVKLNSDNEPDICSVKLLGYTYCTVEDGDDPNKCNPSSAITFKNISKWHHVKIIAAVLILFIAF
jgi:hypothetical protein